MGGVLRSMKTLGWNIYSRMSDAWGDLAEVLMVVDLVYGEEWLKF